MKTKRVMDKKKRKSLISALVTGALTAVLYSSIFPLNKLSDFLLCGAASVLLGWVAYQMAQGLDTSKKAPVQKKIPVTGNPTVDQLIVNGQEMLGQIREVNRQIPDPELSDKMEQLDSIANQIFLTVTDKPEKAPQIRKFMNYYLPTVLKMLQYYQTLNEREVTGENAEKTKKRVEEAMDIVLEAFHKQHDQLYQHDMLDITSDISVLETMLKQDGLIENVPLNGKEKQAVQTSSRE